MGRRWAMSEIGNYYEPYRRRERERAAAIETRKKHLERQAECERLVDEGIMRKVVTEDKAMHLKRIHYEYIDLYDLQHKREKAKKKNETPAS